MPKRKRSATPESLDDGVDDDACSLGNFLHILRRDSFLSNSTHSFP